MFLTKINKNAQIVWSKAFIGDGGNSIQSITNDKDGNIYDPQDIYQNVNTPKIIAKWVMEGEKYSIKQ